MDPTPTDQPSAAVLTEACPDCQARIGQKHRRGCDVARCLATGWQRLMCELGDIDHDGGCGQDTWTGRWPGEVECEEFGWWVQDRCAEGLGFVPCDPSAPGAGHDLNRLRYDAVWDPATGRYQLKTPSPLPQATTASPPPVPATPEGPPARPAAAEPALVLDPTCWDCGVPIGQAHQEGCDWAVCLATGDQRLMCDGYHEGVRDGDCGQDTWTGRPSGYAECAEFGWWARFDSSGRWVPCSADEPGARPDTTRLIGEAEWNPTSHHWQLPVDQADILGEASAPGFDAEQLVGRTLVDSAGHELTVTGVRRDGDRWAIIGTVICPGCGSPAHGSVQENTEAAWATDEDLRERYVYGWELPDPIDPHDDLAVPSGVGRLVRDDPAWCYQGLHATVATRRLRVWRTGDGALVAVLTEGPGAEGTSLANAAEAVVAQLQAEYGPDVEVIEHQLPWNPSRPGDGDGDEQWTLTGLPMGGGDQAPDGVEYLVLPRPTTIPGGLERILLDVNGQPTWWPVTGGDLARRLAGGAW